MVAVDNNAIRVEAIKVEDIALSRIIKEAIFAGEGISKS